MLSTKVSMAGLAMDICARPDRCLPLTRPYTCFPRRLCKAVPLCQLQCTEWCWQASKLLCLPCRLFESTANGDSLDGLQEGCCPQASGKDDVSG